MPQITQDINQSLKEFLNDKSYSKIAILVDENTHEFCLPELEIPFEDVTLIKIESGEANKTLNTCNHIWQAMTEAGFDRKSLLINLGGGVIGDMGGFCAATYKRGIEFVNIPTTLLAQVDASIGGKLGIDFNGFKNHIGIFKSPKEVFISTSFLKTLPKRELLSGFAEIVKHALIASKKQWNNIKLKRFDEHEFSLLVAESVTIKESVVDQDPTEKGLRKILNFGHTIGHAIESYFLNKGNLKLLHGEAVAIGMICEAFIAEKKQLITQDELNEISHFIKLNYSKIQIYEADFSEIIKLMHMDKKNVNNKILLALPDGIGKAKWDIEVEHSALEDALHYYINC